MDENGERPGRGEAAEPLSADLAGREIKSENIPALGALQPAPAQNGVKESISWYPRSPKVALQTLAGQTLEEHGAYSVLQDHIVLTCNNLADNPRRIAGILGVDVRVWKRLKKALITNAGFYVFDQLPGPTLLRSRECDKIVDTCLARLHAARDAGFKSGISRRYKSNPKTIRNNEISRTTVPTGVATAAATDASIIDRYLHNLPSEDCGDTCRKEQIARGLLAEVRAKLGPKWKAWMFEGVTEKPGRILVWKKRSLWDRALTAHGQDFDAMQVTARWPE